MSENDAEPVAGGVPPMPRPSPHSFGDLPLQTGSTSTLGIKVKSRDNAFYFLAARGALRRYGRRFPLTEEGWLAAWTAFAGEDPVGATRYRTSLDPSSSRPSVPAAALAGNSADFSDGWLYIMAGGIGWLIASILGYEGLRHVSAVAVVMGGLVAFFSVVAAFIGAVTEGIRLARHTS